MEYTVAAELVGIFFTLLILPVIPYQSTTWFQINTIVPIQQLKFFQSFKTHIKCARKLATMFLWKAIQIIRIHIWIGCKRPILTCLQCRRVRHIIDHTCCCAICSCGRSVNKLSICSRVDLKILDIEPTTTWPRWSWVTKNTDTVKFNILNIIIIQIDKIIGILTTWYFGECVIRLIVITGGIANKKRLRRH